ncbi:Acyl-protein thioesterase 1 [Rhodotorula toruloides]|nr:Acyl-protein thioesterase 1 [Rhodotorula toruloides]
MRRASWVNRLVNDTSTFPADSSLSHPSSSPAPVPSVVLDVSARGGLDVPPERIPKRRRNSAAIVPASTPETTAEPFSSRRSLPHASLGVASDAHDQLSTQSGGLPHSPTKSTFCDPLISLTPSDLRRPSFATVGPSTSPPYRARAQTPWKPLLRAIRLACIALLGFFLLLRLATFLRPSPEDLSPSSVSTPRRKPPFSKSRSPSPRLPPSPSDRLTLHPTELEYWQDRRQEWFWRRPDQQRGEELEVVTREHKEGSEHEATVIYLTGLGQTPDDALLPDVASKSHPSVRWVIPVAPKIPITVSNQTLRPAWYDIRRFPYDPIADRDHERLFASARGVNEVIRRERGRLIRSLRARGGGSRVKSEEGEDAEIGTEQEKDWASKRILVTGFSQGGVLALLVALTHERMLGGAMVLSGYLPVREDMSRLVFDLDRRELPIFWGHGEADVDVTYSDAVLSAALLSPLSLTRSTRTRHLPATSLYYTDPSTRLNLTNTQFRSYPGLAHAWSEREVRDVRRWLRGVLPREGRGEKVPRWD